MLQKRWIMRLQGRPEARPKELYGPWKKNWDRISCGPGWPWTPYVVEAGLEVVILLHFLSTEIMDICHHVQFYACNVRDWIQGLCLLDKQSTNWAVDPAQELIAFQRWQQTSGGFHRLLSSEEGHCKSWPGYGSGNCETWLDLIYSLRVQDLLMVSFRGKG